MLVDASNIKFDICDRLLNRDIKHDILLLPAIKKKPLYLYSYEKPQLLASDGFIEREVIAREIASNRISCYIIYLYCSERKDAVLW